MLVNVVWQWHRKQIQRINEGDQLWHSDTSGAGSSNGDCFGMERFDRSGIIVLSSYSLHCDQMFATILRSAADMLNIATPGEVETKSILV